MSNEFDTLYLMLVLSKKQSINLVYLLSWAYLLARYNRLFLADYLDNLCLLNCVFSSIGIEAKGGKSLWSMASYVYVGVASWCITWFIIITFHHYQDLTQIELVLSLVLLNLIFLFINTLEISLSIRQDYVIEKKCVIDKILLIATILIQLLTTLSLK